MTLKKFAALMTVAAVLSLTFAGCSGETSQAPETQAPAVNAEAPAPQAPAGEEVLNLADFTLTASTWSSPNGATVHLSATPAGYADGQSAAFIVRLEGEEVKNIPCSWDGKAYTASADLNGADGYCYYVSLTGSKGETVEIPVNTPTEPLDETLINMAASLDSMCSLIVDSSYFSSQTLMITGGTVVVKPPMIRNQGQAITCASAELILSLDGQEIGRTSLSLPAPGADGSYALALTDAAFPLPALQDDQQLAIGLSVKLSNNQSLSAEGGTWFYHAGDLTMAVG